MNFHKQLRRDIRDLITNIVSYNAIGVSYSFWRQRPWIIAAIAKGKAVLDLGSGPCINGVAAALRNGGYVVCLDISKTMAHMARYTINKFNVLGDAVVADALKTPFRSNSFDAILAIAVVHHIPKPFLSMLFSEARRILKVLGIFVVTVWSWRHRRFALRTLFNTFSTLFGTLGYLRRYVIFWRSRRGYFKRVYYLYDLKELVETIKSSYMVVASSGYTWYIKQDNRNVYVVVLKSRI
ncbi:MAG: class I SAM-dependent methyltransferase [Ignisphaera sp.]